jgi:hypothetical protein
MNSVSRGSASRGSASRDRRWAEEGGRLSRGSDGADVGLSRGSDGVVAGLEQRQAERRGRLREEAG